MGTVPARIFGETPLHRSFIFVPEKKNRHISARTNKIAYITYFARQINSWLRESRIEIRPDKICCCWKIKSFNHIFFSVVKFVGFTSTVKFKFLIYFIFLVNFRIYSKQNEDALKWYTVYEIKRAEYTDNKLWWLFLT